MKQEIEIFNDYDIKAIKKWIELNEYDKIIKCPFNSLPSFNTDPNDVYYYDLLSDKSCPDKCNYMFPKLAFDRNIYAVCPCHNYSIEYVKYRALRFITEYESLKNKKS